MKIYKRLIIDEIAKYLKTRDIIVLHGARQVGKTSIMHFIKEELDGKKARTHYIDLEDSRYVRILDAGTEEFMKYLKEEGLAAGLKPAGRNRLHVFIDEIQYLAEPSSFLKLMADHYPQIKLIVSGSSSFNIKRKFKDSLVGRTVDFEIFNLSFGEFLMFKGYHFERSRVFTQKKIKELISFYEEFVLYGGYPKIALTGQKEAKEKHLQQIIDTYIKKDIRDLAAIKDINKFNKLLEVLAAQSGQLLNVAELANTVNLAKPTIEHYLFLLEQTYIIKLVRPFSRNIRSELSKMPKVFFYDTGLMQMLWLKELPKEILGPVFETNIFTELVKKYGAEKINFWRTLDKKEVDFVVRSGQTILPLEVKLNFSRFQPSAIKYFLEKYKLKEFRLVALRGIPKGRASIYPWQI